MPEFPESQGLPSEPKANILLVDDNPANLRSLLEGLGQNLVEARSGEEAIGQVKRDEFAVILLDVLMPGINGFETAAVIRGQKRSQHTPIIFLTAGDIDRSQMEEGYALGAVDFLVKPILAVAIQAKVRGFVQLFQDRQRATHEAEQLRLLVLGTTEYAIFMLNPHGRVLTWNAGAERFKGYRAEEIIGQHFTKFYPQEAIDRGWPAHELKVATKEGRFEDEGWRVRKDGTQFWANVVITALYGKDGLRRGYSKITRDMTERKVADENARRLLEEATARRVSEENACLIREERERLRVTLASIGDAVISTDADGRVMFLNPVAEELVGWTTDEAATHILTDVFHIMNEQTRLPVENPVFRAIKEGMIVGLAKACCWLSQTRVRFSRTGSAVVQFGSLRANIGAYHLRLVCFCCRTSSRFFVFGRPSASPPVVFLRAACSAERFVCLLIVNTPEIFDTCLCARSLAVFEARAITVPIRATVPAGCSALLQELDISSSAEKWRTCPRSFSNHNGRTPTTGRHSV